jgi:2'-5' RNA ligase
MRGFIAVPLEARDNFIPLLESIKNEYGKTAKPVPMDQIHITIKFFNEISGTEASAISEIIEKFQFGEFRIRAESVGQFPGRGLANVLFVKIYSPDIYMLEKKLSSALVEIGIPEEKKPFVPHITISRFRKPTDIHNIIVRFGKEKFADETCRKLIFFRSELTSGGPHYEILKEAQLK